MTGSPPRVETTLPALDARIRPDEWLGGLLGTSAFHVRIEDDGPFDARLSADLDRILREQSFVDAKVPTEWIGAAHELESRGFRLVDTNVRLEASMPLGDRPYDGEVRAAAADDEFSVGRISADNLVTSRFHLDPAIANIRAAAIKESWARNYFRGARGDSMIVATRGSTLVGFLQLLVSDATLVIDLIAVDGTARRTGLASAMIGFASSLHPLADHVVVGTQVSNTASLRFYESLGFRVAGSEYVFHHHGG